MTREKQELGVPILSKKGQNDNKIVQNLLKVISMEDYKV